ncbi:MAG: adenylate/guanylate cyclase domain-containing protein [Treponema sp.]|nr:adenylate/guanylate cyclase domain-containing protein [Treponema sp.]
MSIRLKTIVVVMPLLIASVVLAGVSSYFSAASAVTRLAVDFLTFKAEELENYANSQWNLLVDNGFVGRSDMEQAAQTAVQSFGRSILRSSTEAIFAMDNKGSLALQIGAIGSSSDLSAELDAIQKAIPAGQRGFVTLSLGGIERVAVTFPFVPFGWQVFVSEQRQTFFGDVETIAQTTLYILLGASLISILLLLLMTGYLTRPIEKVVGVMRRIIESNNLSERVPVLYKDEIGQLSHTFNLMLEELDQAYNQIKKYAFEAVVAQKRENRIRNIFQLYVPKDVIDEVFMNPDKMLVGNNRDVSILFSDIRSFTTISEKMAPDALVNALNRYFSIMVDVIVARNGMVDKYIGDAIMAVFGAPVSHGHDAMDSVLAGLEMTEALTVFNDEQKRLGGPEFKIGVGINYGIVTVGNIGCDKKMNYTVIGDTVNLASRLEGLTKHYHQPILFSDYVYEHIKGKIPCRMVDKVAVKGKTQGVPILTARREISKTEAEAWKIHEEAVDLYYRRSFGRAAELFEKILALLPGDDIAAQYLERSHRYAKNPPPADWDGVEVMTEK